MVFPFARHVSERGRGHPDGFRFSKLNWRANALRWRIDYCQPTPLSIRSLRRCHGPEFRSSDARMARGPSQLERFVPVEGLKSFGRTACEAKGEGRQRA